MEKNSSGEINQRLTVEAVVLRACENCGCACKDVGAEKCEGCGCARPAPEDLGMIYDSDTRAPKSESWWDKVKKVFRGE